MSVSIDLDALRAATKAFVEFGAVFVRVMTPVIEEFRRESRRWRDAYQEQLYKDAKLIDRVWNDRDLRVALYRAGFDIPWEPIR